MARTYGTISAAQEQGISAHMPTLDQVFCLLETMYAQQAHAPTPSINLRRSDYTTLVTGYQLIWQALERAGLHLDHAPNAVDSAAPGWFFRWHAGPRHGPFATLDATLTAALDHVHLGRAGTKEGCACARTHTQPGSNVWQPQILHNGWQP